MFSSNASQVSNDANYIEQVFSTYLYTGNGSTQTITNGIDLAGKGGLVWSKGRNNPGYNHTLMSTAYSGMLFSDTTQGANDYPTDINSYNSNGFTLKASTNYANITGTTYASWTFRKQPKFFDVVTYTGNGAASQLIPHNLQSTPGFLMVKSTSNSDDWGCWHRSGPAGEDSGGLSINSTSARQAGGLSSFFTSTTFDAAQVYDYQGATKNVNGRTYVAYLYAHNAGGFGLSGTDNVISCGSFTTDGSGGVSVNLGYEPQWLMFKASNSTGPWFMVDNMRGFSLSANANALLRANTTGAETIGALLFPSATGFYAPAGTYSAGTTYIYIAIRRGPMAVPTDGTKVFMPVAYSGNNSVRTITAGFPIDADINMVRSSAAGHPMVSRLTGGGDLATNSTGSEGTSYTNYLGFDNQTGMAFKDATGYSYYNSSANTYVAEMFRRAPSFFDEVCYTGTGSATTVTHNLGVVPEMIIVKTRSNAVGWAVSVGAVGYTNGGRLELTDPFYSEPNRITGTPTTTTFPIGTDAYVNVSARTYVAYLFASCPGVSKVGTYTGTGTTQTINCGFTAGARFVLIKAASTTGDWLVADSARGIVSGNDPYLELNTTNAEVTGEDWLDTDSSGFVVNEVSGSNANTNGVTYIYLAIA